MHATADQCESCGAPLAQDAVVCVQCGYDRRLGARRGQVWDRRRIRSDEDEGLVIDKEGLWDLLEPPWKVMRPWVTNPFICLILIALLVPFCLNPSLYMTVFAVVGCLAIINQAWVALVAYEESFLEFLLVLGIPFYVVYYIITRWGQEVSFYLFLFVLWMTLYLCIVGAIRPIVMLFMPA